jgi:hypothetical protein
MKFHCYLSANTLFNVFVSDMRFEVFTSVNIWISVCWLVALFGLVGGYPQNSMVSQLRRPQYMFISDSWNFVVSFYLFSKTAILSKYFLSLLLFYYMFLKCHCI